MKNDSSLPHVYCYQAKMHMAPRDIMCKTHLLARKYEVICGHGRHTQIAFDVDCYPCHRLCLLVCLFQLFHHEPASSNGESLSTSPHRILLKWTQDGIVHHISAFPYGAVP